MPMRYSVDIPLDKTIINMMSSETLLLNARPNKRPRSSSRRDTRLARTNGFPEAAVIDLFCFSH
ncbi:unnamed protein product [Gulo gulo]|uniref:Uncharacterized protein n=1 Tax=Gulo gulo TaxID=48420 RepID=A0A9X9LS59_GULGU|nr:unnamed protein product [Gulo gulo]